MTSKSEGENEQRPQEGGHQRKKKVAESGILTANYHTAAPERRPFSDATCPAGTANVNDRFGYRRPQGSSSSFTIISEFLYQFIPVVLDEELKR